MRPPTDWRAGPVTSSRWSAWGHGIWEDAGAYFGGPGKQVVEILDFDHAAEPVWAVAHALDPADEAAAAAWAEPLVAALARSDPTVAAVVAREQGYFTYHADRMDYPRYRRHGLPIRAKGRWKAPAKSS